MNEAIQAVISILTARHIDYTLVEHIPVYTIDEMAALHLPKERAVAYPDRPRTARGRLR